MTIRNGPHLGQLDLNLFRVFDCIYRERSLTRAAAVLHVSQSAVSHALGRLRRQFDDPLFVREGAGVVPTQLADRLSSDIGAALALLAQSLERTRGFEPSRDLGRIVLGMSETLEPVVLPAVVTRLRAENPHVEVQSVRLDRASLRTDLAAGRLDLAVDVAQPTSNEIRHELLFRDDFCVLAARRRRLDTATYLAAEHVTVSSRRTGPGVEDFVFGRLGVRRRVVIRCQDYETASRMVEGTDLLLTLPRRFAAARRDFGRGSVSSLPLEVPPLELHLYWHRLVENEPANRWLREQMLALARAKR